MTDTARIRPWPKYLSIVFTSFQQAIAYRVTTLFNVALTFIWVFILYYLWAAAFSERDLISGYTWAEMRTYVVLAYGINALVGWRVGSQMMGAIRTGEIVRDLVRPLNYCNTQLAMAVGFSIVEGIISFVLTLGLGLFILDIQAPASPGMFVLFLFAVLVGYVTKALIFFIVSLLTFWTLNGVGLMWAQQAVIAILSGTLVPIEMMPGWLRILAEVLPMRGIVSTPLRLYLGKAEGWEIAWLLGLQFFWLAVLWIVANKAWRKAFNAVEIQGG
ncbi:MAG TPA: ABC-2 family transporter protein [Thermomicrobiales bacterium]|nr:ABC-2 family transporter protein [Thermomicrobiales bacterium]